MVNLTKDFHKLLQDPLLCKSPTPLPHLNISPIIPEAWQAQKPTSSSTFPHSSIWISSSSQKHILLSLPPHLQKVYGPRTQTPQRGLQSSQSPQDPTSPHFNRPTRPLCPLFSLSRPPHPKPSSSLCPIHPSRKQDVVQ